MTVAQLEPYVDVDAVAAYFCMSRRWVEYRIKDGLPCKHMGRSRRFRLSDCEDWLVKEGHIREDR